MPDLPKPGDQNLADAIDAEFSRVQFTPDLLPADVVGTTIYNPTLAEFTIRKGPIFANFVLADEINRAPAKVQSAPAQGSHAGSNESPLARRLKLEDRFWYWPLKTPSNRKVPTLYQKRKPTGFY
ncbi:MAG: AAA family ATPase [Saprospiraceae bacterium]